MKRLRRYKDILLINLITVILGIGLFFETDSSEVLMAVIAGGISISFGVRQYIIEQDRIFLELFTNFNKRYDHLNQNLELIIQGKELKDSDPDKTAIIQDYLNLCAEEYLWFKKGRIDENVWLSWKQGILLNLESQEIREYFINEKDKEQRIHADSYYGFLKWLEENLDN